MYSTGTGLSVEDDTDMIQPAIVAAVYRLHFKANETAQKKKSWKEKYVPVAFGGGLSEWRPFYLQTMDMNFM